MCAADDDEAMRSYRIALENSMTGASAAHPYELIGDEKMSLAKVAPRLQAIHDQIQNLNMQIFGCGSFKLHGM